MPDEFKNSPGTRKLILILTYILIPVAFLPTYLTIVLSQIENKNEVEYIQ